MMSFNSSTLLYHLFVVFSTVLIFHLEYHTVNGAAATCDSEPCTFEWSQSCVDLMASYTFSGDGCCLYDTTDGTDSGCTIQVNNGTCTWADPCDNGCEPPCPEEGVEQSCVVAGVTYTSTDTSGCVANDYDATGGEQPVCAEDECADDDDTDTDTDEDNDADDEDIEEEEDEDEDTDTDTDGTDETSESMEPSETSAPTAGTIRVSLSLGGGLNLCLNVPNKVSQGTGDKLKIWGCNGRDKQEFDYNMDDGTIRSVVEPGKCLTLKGNAQGKVFDGAHVLVQDCVSDTNLSTTSRLLALRGTTTTNSDGGRLLDGEEDEPTKEEQQQMWLFVPDSSSTSTELFGMMQSLWKQKKCIKGSTTQGGFARIFNCEKGDPELMTWYVTQY